MPREALVGDDHDGTHNYLDSELWWAAESSVDYGMPIVALCKGNFGSNFTLSGTSVNGAEIKSLDAIYNGSNDVGLAVCKSMNLQAVIDIHDVAILPTSAFFAALSMNANSDGSTLYNLYVEHLTANGVGVVVVAGNCPNSLLRNSVLNGGVNGIDYGYNYKLNVEHLTVSNASNIGLKGSLSVSTATNCFSLNNTNGDHSDIVKVNCASSDATGNPGLTGYTDTELVNLAGKDFRTKATSPLATAGTNSTYIGAFMEESGGPETYNFSATINQTIIINSNKNKKGNKNAVLAQSNKSNALTNKSANLNSVMAQNYQNQATATKQNNANGAITQTVLLTGYFNNSTIETHQFSANITINTTISAAVTKQNAFSGEVEQAQAIAADTTKTATVQSNCFYQVTLNGQSSKQTNISGLINQTVQLNALFINTAAPIHLRLFRIDGQIAFQRFNGAIINQRFNGALT
jgi:hypothetical protein